MLVEVEGPITIHGFTVLTEYIHVIVWERQFNNELCNFNKVVHLSLVV